MDLYVDAEARAAADALYAWVDDLERYPRWLEIVRRATPAEPAPGDEGPAWWVDLRGRLGPFARSKRLRMVRVVHEAPTRAVFERRELDGRAHAMWRLSADVEPTEGEVTRLRVHLHYAGGLFAPVLERLLADEVARARPRLVALAESPG